MTVNVACSSRRLARVKLALGDISEGPLLGRAEVLRRQRSGRGWRWRQAQAADRGSGRGLSARPPGVSSSRRFVGGRPNLRLLKRLAPVLPVDHPELGLT